MPKQILGPQPKSQEETSGATFDDIYRAYVNYCRGCFAFFCLFFIYDFTLCPAKEINVQIVEKCINGI